MDSFIQGFIKGAEETPHAFFAVAMANFALRIYAREFGSLGNLKQNLRKRLTSAIQEYVRVAEHH